ncbi:MAG: type 1 glutamine amidotransferase domain-containing protein [Gemmatimonadaceae bacterium]
MSPTTTPDNERLTGRRVAVLATDGVEQVELDEPVRALRAAGATVDVIAPSAGNIQGMDGLDRSSEIPVDCTLADAATREYDALVLPGGVANPDRLRTDEAAVAFVRQMMESDRPVAAICHGPWLLVEAGLVRGRTLTSWPSLRTDIRNAGGEWVDRQVVVDQKLITSRNPDDLPAFCDRLVTVLASAAAERSLDAEIEQSFPASDPLPAPTAATGRGNSSGAANGDSPRPASPA